MPQRKYDFLEAKSSQLQTKILKRRKGNAVFGHRSRRLMRSLTSQGKTVGIHCFENPLLSPLQARTAPNRKAALV